MGKADASECLLFRGTCDELPNSLVGISPPGATLTDKFLSSVSLTLTGRANLRTFVVDHIHSGTELTLLRSFETVSIFIDQSGYGANVTPNNLQMIAISRVQLYSAPLFPLLSFVTEGGIRHNVAQYTSFQIVAKLK
jgi:hypothetical protein